MDRWRFVGGKIVQHDMDLQCGFDACFDLPEQRHEILGAMPGCTPRQDFPRRDVQRGKQIQRAVAKVIVGPPFGCAQVHRQDRLRTFECLDLGFLIEREHHRIVGRIHIQPDDITHLVHQLGIRREFERARDVRLETKRAPDAADHRMTHARLGGHRPRAPMGLALRRGLERLHDHRLDFLIRDAPGSAHAGFVIQTLEPAFNEPLTPFPDGGICRPMAPRHRQGGPGATPYRITLQTSEELTSGGTGARTIRRDRPLLTLAQLHAVATRETANYQLGKRSLRTVVRMRWRQPTQRRRL